MKRLTTSRCLVVLLFILVSCGGLPNADCPQLPTASDRGQPAQRSANSSINIELSQSYMRNRVRALVETPETAEVGVDVGTVSLEESVIGTERLNLVSIVITPWLRSADTGSAPAVLPRSYILRLKIIPYLVTPSTTPDTARRQELLCPTGDTACIADSGVILSFEFHELFSRIHQEAVSCTSSNYDFIDARVLAAVYDALRAQGPLLLPANQLTDMVSGIIDQPVNLIGVNVGSDLDLKIGFLLDQGSPDVFDPNTSLSRFPGRDWGVSIDTDFINTEIQQQAIAQATSDSRVQNANVTVDYTPTGIDVAVTGYLNLPVCGFDFSSNVTISPEICKDAMGNSVIRICTSEPVTTTTAGICSAVALSFTGGLATAVVSSGGVTDNCVVLSQVQFGSDANDVFYGTNIDTDNVFYIAGRSSFMDDMMSQSSSGARPVLPLTCP